MSKVARGLLVLVLFSIISGPVLAITVPKAEGSEDNGTVMTEIVLTVPQFIVVKSGEPRVSGSLVLITEKGTAPTFNGTMTVRITTGNDTSILIDGTVTNELSEVKENVPFDYELPCLGNISVGPAVLSVEFAPDEGSKGLVFPSSKEIDIEVWSSTRIKEVFVEPKGDDYLPTSTLDFLDRIDEMVFTFQVLEGVTVETTGGPIPDGNVWFNITMGSYKNSTLRVTNESGMVNFSFTEPLRDTATGNPFTVPSDTRFANMTIEVKFEGKDFYQECMKILRGNTPHSIYVHPPGLNDVLTRDHILYAVGILGFLICLIILASVFISMIKRSKRYTVTGGPTIDKRESGPIGI